MLSSPPGRNRPTCSSGFPTVAEFLRDLGDAVAFEANSAYDQPGPVTGSARSGGDTYRFAVEYLFSQVVSKFDDSDKASDSIKSEAALEKFRLSEAMCAATNARFSKYFLGHRPPNEDVSAVLRIAREKIWRLFEGFTLAEVESGFTFTGGASFGLPRSRSTPAHKYSTQVETTSNAKLAVQCAMRTSPLWGSLDGPGTVVVPGNKLTCVPKNYKVHRLIAQEPSGNMYLQKGLGAAIRRRLKTVGVDLSNQVTNQDFSLLGSVTGLVATVDLSMASDTVSTAVVEWFLPPDVYEFANAIRSTSGVLPSGENVLYRKFSSMGNAATFEIETLIFWGLVQACCVVGGADGRFTAVYGDDIVIPVSCVNLLFLVLEECGFVPNSDKTFWDGPEQTQGFRESCGKHYLNGQDVTPFYIKNPVGSMFDLFLMVNNCERWVRRMADVMPHKQYCSVKAVLAKYRQFAKPAWVKPRIPDGFGDGAFIGTFDEVCPRPAASKKRMWVEGFVVEVLVEGSTTADYFCDDGPLFKSNRTCPLYGRKLYTVESDKRKRFMYRKVTKSLTESGLLLASLSKLEKRPWSPWHDKVFHDPCPSILARAYVMEEPSEDSGVLIQPRSAVRIASMVIPGFLWS